MIKAISQIEKKKKKVFIKKINVIQYFFRSHFQLFSVYCTDLRLICLNRNIICVDAIMPSMFHRVTRVSGSSDTSTSHLMFLLSRSFAISIGKQEKHFHFKERLVANLCDAQKIN
jgi:hypothetical protein